MKTSKIGNQTLSEYEAKIIPLKHCRTKKITVTCFFHKVRCNACSGAKVFGLTQHTPCDKWMKIPLQLTLHIEIPIYPPS
jgi:hypothetical protein